MKPHKMDFAEMVSDMNANVLVGDTSIFERVVHVLLNHMVFSSPLPTPSCWS